LRGGEEVSHIERVLPLDDDNMRRIKAKYASKKPIYGRGNSGCGKHKKYPNELIAHIRFLHERLGVTYKAIAGRYSIGEAYVRAIMNYQARPTVKPCESLHESLRFERQ
jgi:hypothetical protein